MSANARWRQYAPLKRQSAPTRLHCATSQNALMFILAAVRIWNLTNLIFLLSDRERKRAHFYVYCSWPCKEMKHGKLRVRCASCQSGAFTVDRDPQCWDDVLKSRRITGDCQNDTCVCKALLQYCCKIPFDCIVFHFIAFFTMKQMWQNYTVFPYNILT
jgi:hypothetical protein